MKNTRFTSNPLSAIASIVLSIATGATAATLDTPADGTFLKTPNRIYFTAKGVLLTKFASVKLTGENYSQTGWWYSYYGESFTMNLNEAPPNNRWVTATFVDGAKKSIRTYWTAYPWAVPSEIAKLSASSTYQSFEPGYCTNFASRAFHTGPSIRGSFVPWTGDAQTWYSNASKAGWKTTKSRDNGQIGSVIVWKGGTFGHVGIVVDMNRKGKTIEYTVQDMNWGPMVNSALAITENFGKVRSVKINSSSDNQMRPSSTSSYEFTGFILPERR